MVFRQADYSEILQTTSKKQLVKWPHPVSIQQLLFSCWLLLSEWRLQSSEILRQESLLWVGSWYWWRQTHDRSFPSMDTRDHPCTIKTQWKTDNFSFFLSFKFRPVQHQRVKTKSKYRDGKASAGYSHVVDCVNANTFHPSSVFTSIEVGRYPIETEDYDLGKLTL